MSGKSFLRQVAGVLTEVLGIQTSAGAGNAGDIPALDASGRLDVSMMPVGIGPEVTSAEASENLSAGDAVNLWLSGGVLKARKADASAAGKRAHGFVLSAVTATQTAAVYGPSQTNTGVVGLTIGAEYYLDPATPGGITATPPTGAGKVSQRVGVAASATSLVFDPSEPITLAS